jgi:hypothetical protein
MAGDLNERLRLGIIETARAIGADPLDLATAISYETAGTFDPTKRGPTTQWGQHRGLIQFGEPQAQQYGVDWNDPLGSQLGPNGAIAKYFISSGFKPGMSGLDLYSTINAGAPGKYGASDANNGGAPGNVRDKWERQMGGHREKAAALLGDIAGSPRYAMASASPMPSGQGQMPGQGAMPQQMAQAFGDVVAPQAPMSFGNVLDSFNRRRRQADEEEQARQSRLAALFASMPA